MSGVAVNDGCVDLYNQIKMKKDHRFRWQEACMDARVKNEMSAEMFGPTLNKPSKDWMCEF